MKYTISVLTMCLALALFGVVGTTHASAEDTINLNTATATQLAEAMDGVGASRARAIVEYRERFGAFGSLEELLAVRGIGESVLAANRHKITVQE